MSEKRITCHCGIVYFREDMVIEKSQLYSNGDLRGCPLCSPDSWKNLLGRPKLKISAIGHNVFMNSQSKFKHEVYLDLIRDLLKNEEALDRQIVLPKLFVLLEGLINHTISLHQQSQKEVKKILRTQLAHRREHRNRYAYYIEEAANMIYNNETWAERPQEMNF